MTHECMPRTVHPPMERDRFHRHIIKKKIEAHANKKLSTCLIAAMGFPLMVMLLNELVRNVSWPYQFMAVTAR